MAWSGLLGWLLLLHDYHLLEELSRPRPTTATLWVLALLRAEMSAAYLTANSVANILIRPSMCRNQQLKLKSDQGTPSHKAPPRAPGKTHNRLQLLGCEVLSKNEPINGRYEASLSSIFHLSSASKN
ncbi:hypothetical protein BGY98DRAFT_564196 [Russula aff. rugulosa BPL654]|nr:hypothetical protein BGY98DRAFT_564196 [Russula aff. rugulosa BPL654]